MTPKNYASRKHCQGKTRLDLKSCNDQSSGKDKQKSDWIDGIEVFETKVESVLTYQERPRVQEGVVAFFALFMKGLVSYYEVRTVQAEIMLEILADVWGTD